MNKSSNITILEASLLTGKSQSTVYKYIERGTIPCEKNIINGKEYLTLKKKDIERVFNIICPESEEDKVMESSTHTDKAEHVVRDEEHLTAEKVREVMEEFFSTKQAELVKPVEQQSLYRLGRVEQENQFLKEKLETLLEENRKLQEENQIFQKELKSLPVLAESMKNLDILREENVKIKEENSILQEDLKSLTVMSETIKNLEKENIGLQEENQTLHDKLKASPGPSIEKVLMDNASNLKILSRDKTELQERLREKEEVIQTQYARLLKEKEEALEEQKAMFLARMEEEKGQLLESWQQEKDEKKAWWKFW
ncbi:MAG: hypothetical protein ABRQ39_02905 [Candidatus Eremiobacterota bacterium]